MKVSSIEPLEARIAPAVLTITPVEPSPDEGSTIGSTTNIQFKITLDTAEAQDVSVLATAFAGTASIGADLAAFSQTIIIPKGQTEFIFNVPIKHDTTIESDETFSVKLSSPSANATLGPEGTETAIGTIHDDDVPTVTITGPGPAPEGSAVGGKTNFTFTIKLDQKSSVPIQVKVSTKDGTASVSDSDYVALEDFIVTIPADTLEQTFTVEVNHDTKVEGTETFSVELKEVLDGRGVLGTTKQATGTITEDDPPKLSISPARVEEGNDGETPRRQLVFKVQLTGEAAEDVSVDWLTQAGTALEGIDFIAASGTVTIPAGETEAEIRIDIVGDDLDERDEVMTVSLGQTGRMGNQTIPVVGGPATGTILNDELSVSLSGQSTVTEGNPTTDGPTVTTNDYTLTLSEPTSHDVVVTVEIVDGTAKLGSDFTGTREFSVTIPANTGSANFSIPIKIDQIFEGDETFEVRIKSIKDAVVGSADAITTTIVNDDAKPTLSVVSTTVPEGNDSREVQVTVKLSGATEGPVTFDWSTVDGIAIAGLDFEAVSNQTVTIADGATTATIILTLLGDTVWEGDETLSIVLSNVSANAGLGSGNGSGTITIDENQAIPALSIADVSTAENAGTMTFVVSLPSGTKASEDITFDWNAAFGTATAGVDYIATPATVTIPAGQTSATFTVSLLDDGAMEPDETFQVTIGNATFGGANSQPLPITDSQATGRIINDERMVSISTGTLVVAEQNGAEGETPSMVRYVISLTDELGNPLASDRPVTVTLAFDPDASTAESNDIILPANLTVTIPAGSTSVDFDVQIRGDVVFEGDEVLTMKIADSTAAAVGEGSASTTITDEEGVPKLFIEDVKIAEGDSGVIVRKVKVKLNGKAEGDITFDWSTANGTALHGEDYTRNLSGKATIPAGASEVEIDVVLSGDTVNEGDEHFFINISNAVMGESTPVTIDDAQGKITIHNDEVVARIAGGTVTEGDSGTSNLVYSVSIPQASVHDVILTFAVGAEGDTAIVGTDYDLPGSFTVTILAGQTFATISIPIKGDLVSEPNDTLTVKLTDSENAIVSVGTAFGTIVDNDAAPELSINDVTLMEGNTGSTNYRFTISLSGASSQEIKVLVTPTAGTATLGGDFTAEAKLITIPAGATEFTVDFDVAVNGDQRYENDETFTVVLSNAVGASIEDGIGTGTIQNDDPLPTLIITNLGEFEGNSGTRQFKFTIVLSGESDTPIKFKLATAAGDGTNKATPGTDYIAKAAQEFTLAPGQTSMEYFVTVNGDSVFEANETFEVVMTEITGLPGAPEKITGIGTIQNDEAIPKLSIADLVVSEGNSGAKEIELTVSMSSAVGSNVTFDWAALAGTASLGEDFTLVSTSPITIPAGETSAKIKFSIKGDALAELDETFNVTISNPTSGVTIDSANSEATVTIQNDETTLSFLADPTVVEGDDGTQQMRFVIKRDGFLGNTVTVRVDTQDGTARSDGAVGLKDFDAISDMTLTFLPDQTEKEVFVTIHGDTNFDSIDQFRLLLSNSTNAATVDSSATGTISENATDVRPVITIVEDVEGHSIREDATAPATLKFKIKLDRTSDEQVEVAFSTVDGTAVVGSDFKALTAAQSRIVFLPGETEKEVEIEVLNDTLFEAEESFKVELKSPLNATLGEGKERTATIETDDDTQPTIKVTGASIVEGDGGERFLSFVVQRTGATGADISFTFSTLTGPGDTATPGTDYVAEENETFTLKPDETSKTIQVKLSPDTLIEGDETFSVGLTGIVNAGLADPNDDKAKGTILDDDVRVSITPGTYEVSEANAGQTDLVFNVQLNGVSSVPTTVNYAVAAGTATNGTDYQTPTVLSIVIPAGQTTGQIRIPVVGDTTAEENETFTVTLTGATNAELADNNTTATGTILNDDAALVISDGQLVEGGVDAEGDPVTAYMEFTVSLRDASTYPVTVHYSTGAGTATAGTDYTTTEGNLLFEFGQTSLIIRVPVFGDTTSEPHETFTVTLSNATGATILDTEATGTILDDDSAHLSIGDMTVEEGDNGLQNLIFTVTLSGTHTQQVTVDYTTVDGTAKSAGPLLDYLAQKGTLTFDPGETSKLISIPVFGDIWKEVDEQFSVKLSNALIGGSTSGISIDDDTATGKILDNGDATLGVIVNHGRAVEGASGGTVAMNFTIETTAPTTEEITLKASTRAGSAGAADFTGFTGANAKTIKIAAGSSTTTVTVNITGDNFFEDSEFFYLDVSEFGDQVVPVEGSSGRLSAFGVILNDDINIINAREFEYVDKDGDLVHVKFSKGTLSVPATGAGTSSNDITFTIDSSADGLGGRTIKLIDLANDGGEFEGANITVTANQQILVTGEVLGNSKAEVGAIQSMVLGNNIFSITSGVGLGVVKIDGDLGAVVAGSFAKINGIRKLEVDQFGTSGSTAEQDQSVVFGPLGRMIVHGDFLGSLAVVGDAVDQPFPGGIGKIGSLKIEGALRGGSTEGSGQISVTHSIGNAVIGGIVGGAGDLSGLIFGANAAFNASIGKLTVLGDIVGGAGDNSGAVLQLSNLGSLTVGKVGAGSDNLVGNLIGGAGQSSGVIGVNKLGKLSINGDITGGTATSSGLINIAKSLGNTRVTGDVTGSSGTNSGLIAAGVLKGKLAIEGNLSGGSGSGSGRVSINGYTENLVDVFGHAGSITIGKKGVSNSGNILGGDGDDSGKVVVNGNLASFLAYGDLDATAAKGAGVAGLDVGGTLSKAVIKGSVRGGTTEINSTANRSVGSAFIAANQIGSLTIEGIVKSGVKGTTSPSTQSSAFSAGIHSNTSIGTLKILGGEGARAIEGNKDVPVAITAAERIGNVTIGGDVLYAEILAGYNRTTDLTKSRGLLRNAGATIDSVIVDGKWTASSLVAGVYAGADGKFGTADDTESSNGSNSSLVNVDLISRIAKVVINQTIEPALEDAPTDASYAIVAEYLKSVKVNGVAESLTRGSKNDGRETDPGPSKTQIFELFVNPA